MKTDDPSSRRGKYYRPELYTPWQRAMHSPILKAVVIAVGAVIVLGLVALVVFAINRY